uniref:hypothetical protein n=1 Tax=Flavobacterium sp. TaxID=239 RepID=UPI00374D2AF4
MSFKLLAIRPLNDCNPKFLKNLKENQVYQFYNDYEFNYFRNDHEKEILDIEKVSELIPDNFYDLRNKRISISA